MRRAAEPPLPDAADRVHKVPAAPVRRIAVLRPNHRLGNTLLLTPLMQQLEARFPGARIELVTAYGEAPALFRQFPRVSVHAFPDRSWRHPLRVLTLLWRLRRRQYDLAIDPAPRSRNGRFLLQFVRARDRLGYRWGVRLRDLRLTHTVERARSPTHFAQHGPYLLESAYRQAGTDEAAAATAAATAAPLDLRLTEAEREAGRRRLVAALAAAQGAAPATSIGLFVHASGGKPYPLSWWREVVAQLRRALPAVGLVEFVPHDGRARLGELLPAVGYSPDLRLLAATLAASSLVVIPDGGVMHLAEAAGANVLVLFRVTQPAHYAPRRATGEALWAPDASAEAVVEHIRAALARAAGRAGSADHV